jgi:hypothetical protein
VTVVQHHICCFILFADIFSHDYTVTLYRSTPFGCTVKKNAGQTRRRRSFDPWRAAAHSPQECV